MSPNPDSREYVRRLTWWKDNRLLIAVGVSIVGTLLFFTENGKGYRIIAFKKLGNWRSGAEDVLSSLKTMASHGQGFYSEASRAMKRSMGRSEAEEVMTSIRRQIELHTKNPGFVRADMSEGVVTLRGSGLGFEIRDLVRSIEALPGVKQVIDQLDAKKSQSDLNGRTV